MRSSDHEELISSVLMSLKSECESHPKRNRASRSRAGRVLREKKRDALLNAVESLSTFEFHMLLGGLALR